MFGALNNEVVGGHTDQEWSDLVRRFNWRCFYCEKPVCVNSLDRDAELTKDHLVPLSRGGVDFIGNIVPACMRCNSLKGTKTVQEFKASRAGFLPSPVQEFSEVSIATPMGEERPSDEPIEEVPGPVQAVEIGAMWNNVVAAMAKKRGMSDSRPDSWWEQRRRVLKSQAEGHKRQNLEAAGQLTLPIFGDGEPRKLVQTAAFKQPKEERA